MISEFIELIDAVREFDKEKVRSPGRNAFSGALVSMSRSPHRTRVALVSSLLKN
jgi:hypothetical protein